ncbi:MAG: sulfatase [Thermoanaerobaculia bacterium]
MRNPNPRLAACTAGTAAAILLAACGASAPELGSLSGLESVPVRLAQETRPAVAAAAEGRFHADLTLAAGHLVLAFGWKRDGGSQEWAGTMMTVRFRDRDGASHPLTSVPLPPPEGGPEGWLQTLLEVPEALAGRAGTIVFDHGGAGGGGSLFTAVPKLVRATAERPNVLLISIDTLRPDHLGCYGYQRPTSPAIDAMARQGTRFENAVAPSGWTLPSHYSMLTALYPSAHGVHPDRWLFAGVHGAHRTFNIRGSGREVTLAERLEAMGYYTAAITENGWVHSKFGFDQGFASYIDHSKHQLRDGTQPLALRWLHQHRELPFFLFVHTYQPHQPYDQPPPYDTLFVDEDHVGYALPGVAVPMATIEQFRDPTFPPSPEDVAAFNGLYDGEVRYVDTFIDGLLNTLRTLGLDRKTVLLFTSDHGEEIFEHGNFDHGDTLYDEVMRVPFILWGPGRIPAGVVDTPVALVDVVPTLVELAGGKIDGELQGRSLVPLLTGDDGLGDRILFGEGFAEESVPLACAWDGATKLILRGTDLEEAELYDLERDPAEHTNLAAEQPETVARLRQAILAWKAGNARIQAEIGVAEVGLDAETEERLRALGYL